MSGTDYRNGMPMGVSPSQVPASRTAEFSGGVAGGGSTHTVQQAAPTAYKPSSVISPIESQPNGQSSTTYSANRILDYYKA